MKVYFINTSAPRYATVMLDACKLADYLRALFHQSKRFYSENVKAKAMRNEIRKKKISK